MKFLDFGKSGHSLGFVIDKAFRVGHFSFLEKETESLSESLYRMTIYYDKHDETELLIQILSFGPLITVTEPQHFRDKIKDRLRKQRSKKET